MGGVAVEDGGVFECVIRFNKTVAEKSVFPQICIPILH